MKVVYIILTLLALIACETRGAAKKHSIQNVKVMLSDIENSLTCSSEHKRTLLLRAGQKSWHIQFNELIETPVVRADTSCALFLRNWFSILKRSKLPSINLALRSLGQTNRTSYSPERFVFADQVAAKACQKAGFCAANALDLLNSASVLKNCLPKNPLKHSALAKGPKLLSTKYAELPQLTTHIFPPRSLASIYSESLAMNPSSVSYASTMSLSSSLTKQLAQTKEKESLLLLDNGLLFATNQAELLAQEFANAKSSIFPLPILSGGTFAAVFHWKYVIQPENKRFAISAMNLSNSKNNEYLDFVYSIDHQEARDQLLASTNQLIKENCARQSEFVCLSKNLFPEETTSANLEQLFSRSCKFSEKLTFPEGIPRKNIFLEPQTHNIPAIVEQLIKQAKNDIILFTHKFSHRLVMKALADASRRGVNVRVYAGEKARIKPSKVVHGYKDISAVASDRWIPWPHMKLLLIDGETVFTGTGNFTRNALEQAKELFFITKDQNLIQLSKRLAASYDFSIKKSPVSFDLAPNNPIILALAKTSTISLGAKKAKARLQEISRYSVKNNATPTHIRFLNQAGTSVLKKCGLGSLVFVAEKDFFACTSKL